MKYLIVGLILSLFLTTEIYPQSVVPITVTLSSDAVIGLQSFALTQTLQAIVLSASISLTDTTITLQSTVGLTAPIGVLFDNEAMLITAIAGNTATVTRAIFGTTAAIHGTIQGRVLAFSNIVVLLKTLLQQTVGSILKNNPGPLIAAQQSAIIAAQQQIQTLQQEAIQ